MSILNQRKIAIVVLLAVMIIFGETTVFADSFPPPKPFEIWSEDGSRVFKWDPGPELHASYATAQAGVYQNGKLIYSVENLPIVNGSARSFLFSKDLTYFVFTAPAQQVVAFGFFKNGELLRYYRIDELVRDMTVITYTASIAFWVKKTDLDTANNKLTVVTRDDITYVFDITTGEIISDTVGNAPFIPFEEGSWQYRYNERELPLWAQKISDDTPSPWAQRYIDRAGELGILPAQFRSGFRSNATRAEFAAIATTIYEHFKSPVTGRVFFTDTKDANVEKAAYLGIVNGIGNDRFAPDTPLTREQAAVMLTRLARILGISERAISSHHYSDESEISSWAYLDVKQTQSLGIMSGSGEAQFAPQYPYTKEQCIVTILRVYDLVN